MKHWIAIATFSLFSVQGISQVIDESVVIEMAEENVTKNSSDPQEQYRQAELAFNEAQNRLAQAQQERIDADNAYEAARVQLRTASLALQEYEKQQNPTVIERYEVIMGPTYEKMSQGEQPGFTTFIESSDVDGLLNVFSKNVDAELKAYLKQFKSDKVKKQKGELVFKDIVVNQMSTMPMDLFVDFQKENNGVRVNEYFLQNGQFLDFNDDSQPYVKYAYSMMDQFARYMRTNKLEADLNSLEKELQKNQKALQNKKEDIGKMKQEVLDGESEITINRNDLSSYESLIDDINHKIELTRIKLSKVN